MYLTLYTYIQGEGGLKVAPEAPTQSHGQEIHPSQEVSWQRLPS